MKKPPKLSYNKALELMRKGSYLMKSYEGQDIIHYIVKGGYVELDVAKKLKEHNQVVPNNDGVFPGNDQTWRIR